MFAAKQEFRTWALNLAFSIMFFTPSAQAVDGVLEINQSCVATGCFAGDSADFPVTIDNEGSYRLTSNLRTASVNDHGIMITSGNVNLDLNGFSIIGLVSCTGEPPDTDLECSPSGSGSGIRIEAGPATIENGAIQGFSAGVQCLAGFCMFRDLVSFSNSGSGFASTTGGTLIDNCQARRNGLNGIVLTFAHDGPPGTLILNSYMVQNQLNGLSAGSSVSVIGSVIAGNGNIGLETGAQCLVQSSMISHNGEDGILAGSGCNIVDNKVTNNGAIGITLQSTSAGYVRNNISNNVGDEVSGGTDLGQNLCNGSPCTP